jgi:DNA-binding LytR/AlgR family response regulator
MGLVLLSPELRVIGLNDFAGQVFGAATAAVGRNLLDCHPDKSRGRVHAIMREMLETPSGQAKTLIIDVLGKAILTNLSKLTLTSPVRQDCWAVTFFDVTAETGAAKNPVSGLLEMKKIPIAEAGACHFIAIDEVLAICTDGDYCRIFTATGCHYLHLRLKTLLQRYPCPDLCQVHKSHVVNLRHIRQTLRADNKQWQLIIDQGHIPPIPVSRRRTANFKKALATI